MLTTVSSEVCEPAVSSSESALIPSAAVITIPAGKPASKKEKKKHDQKKIEFDVNGR